MIYFEAYASEITLVKNSRTVMDPAHEHTAGDGLELSSDAVMSVNADETTITSSTGQIELMDGSIGWSQLGIDMGDGIESIDSSGDGEMDTLQLDLKSYGGLEFESGELKVDPDDIDGDGLEVDANNDLQVTAGDGLLLSNERVKLDVGNGLILDGTTPDRVLKVDLLSNGGLQFNSGDLEVNPADFDGDGLGVDGSNDLKVKAGDGITLSSDTVKADLSTDHGLELIGTNPNKLIAVDLETGGGLGFTSSGGNIQVAPSDIAGDGLVDSGTGNLEVNSDDLDGDGLITDGSNNLMVDCTAIDGDGLTTDGNNNLEVQVTDFDEGSLGFDQNNNLVVRPGNGISIVADRVTADPGDGLRLDGMYSTPDKPLTIDILDGGGIRMGGTDTDELAVEPGGFACDGLEDDGSNDMQVKCGNGLELDSGYARVKPADVAGSGLSSTLTSLDVDPGDGLKLVSGEVVVDDGQGLTADSADLHASLGNGLNFDASDRIQVDAKTDGGIGFDGGEIMVDTSDLGLSLSDLDKVTLAVDVSTHVGTTTGWHISQNHPCFVAFSSTDNQANGDELEYYIQQDDGSEYYVWINNKDENNNPGVDVKIYTITG